MGIRGFIALALALGLCACAIKWPAPLERRDATTDVTDADDADLDVLVEPDTLDEPDAGDVPDAEELDVPSEPDAGDMTEDVEEEDILLDVDYDCTQGLNIAPPATPRSSGGGTGGYGPGQLNNGRLESTCQFHWVTAGSTPGDVYFEYEFDATYTLWGMWIDTNYWENTVCWSLGGVTLAGGTIQYWDIIGGWTAAGVVSGQSDDWWFRFEPPVSTSQVRIYGAHATDLGGQTFNPLIYEWEVYQCAP